MTVLAEYERMVLKIMRGWLKLHRWFCLAIAILLVCGLTGCLKPQPDSKPETATTVILIRHAERDNFFNLTDLGRKHAAALADAVGDMGIAAIYSPNLERCLDTVKPLANLDI